MIINMMVMMMIMTMATVLIKMISQPSLHAPAVDKESICGFPHHLIIRLIIDIILIIFIDTILIIFINTSMITSGVAQMDFLLSVPLTLMAPVSTQI